MHRQISSIGGLSGEPEIAHYCASKFGVIGLASHSPTSSARTESASTVSVRAQSTRA